MRNYFITPNKIVAQFDDAATALKSGFTEPITIQDLGEIVFRHFTLEFWEGSPSEGWSKYRINEELGMFFANSDGYVSGTLGESGYACTPQCLDDVVYEVNRRLKESGDYEETPAFKTKDA